MNEIRSQFRNIYNEVWDFVFDYTNSVAYVQKSNINAIKYPVINGNVYGVVLSAEEKQKIKSLWNESIQSLSNINMYRGANTEFQFNSRNCWLTNDYCPICLNQRTHFEYHHCIWKKHGGSDDYKNILRICKSCHILISNGAKEEQISKSAAAYYHQLMYFGFELFPQQAVQKGKYRGRNFLEKRPDTAELIGQYNALQTNEERNLVNEAMKSMAEYHYQFFRDLGLGKYPWQDFYVERSEND